MMQNGRAVGETDGAYGGPYVYQALRYLPNFDGQYPVVGSWVVGGEACGVGIREDDSPITRNTSRFVPHVILPR
jgi:glutathionylspermidine synthase